MATNYRRTIVRDGSPAHRMARLETARYAVTHRPSLVMVADNGWFDRRQPAEGRATQVYGFSASGEGQIDRGFAVRSGPSRWDRLVARITGPREQSSAVISADDAFTAQVERYNRVREFQGRPPKRREDFVDVLDRPPSPGGRDA